VGFLFDLKEFLFDLNTTMVAMTTPL